MDRAKKQSLFLAQRNSKIYMDLKDILREYTLPFLPAKSLRRFTSVCRDWKLQISTPFFAHNQSNSFHDVSGFFYLSPSGLPSFVSLDPMAYGVPDPLLKFLPEPVDIRCSSNGLLCCQGRTGYKAYYVCNPVTRQWKKLAKPTADHGPDPALVLVFEPSLLKFVADYTLICAFPSELGGYEFEIYSSAQDSWKISGEICYGNWMIRPSSGIYVRGIVYWLTSMGKVIAFDLTSERTTFIYLSYGYYHGNSYDASLGEMNGKLCQASLISLTLDITQLENSYTNTMQMHSKAKAWNKSGHINLGTLESARGVFVDQGRVEYVGGNLVLIHSGRKLVSYNVVTKALRQVASEVDGGSRMFPYVNSLVEI